MNQKLVKLYKPQNESDFFIISSLLEENEIPFFAKNTKVQNLFGFGQLGSYHNVITGPIVIMVSNSDLERAKIILSEYINNKNGKWDLPDYELNLLKQYNRYLANSILLGVFLPGSGLIFSIKSTLLKLKNKKQLKYNFRFFFSWIFNIAGLLFSLLFIYSIISQ